VDGEVFVGKIDAGRDQDHPDVDAQSPEAARGDRAFAELEGCTERGGGGK